MQIADEIKPIHKRIVDLSQGVTQIYAGYVK